jgi:hypothetical protein
LDIRVRGGSRVTATLSRSASAPTSRTCATPVSPGSGPPYLMLEYVEGERLELYCEHDALDFQQHIELFPTESGKNLSRADCHLYGDLDDGCIVVREA